MAVRGVGGDKARKRACLGFGWGAVISPARTITGFASSTLSGLRCGPRVSYRASSRFSRKWGGFVQVRTELFVQEAFITLFNSPYCTMYSFG
jgi:hypothetical protein